MKDYYQILGLKFDSDGEAIKRAYRKLALKYHPDQNTGSSAQEKFIEITEAYEMLRDDHKRKVYNAMYTSYFMNRARGVGENPQNKNGAFQYAKTKSANGGQPYQYTQHKNNGSGDQGPFRHNSYSYTTTKKAQPKKNYKTPPKPSPAYSKKSTIHTKYFGILTSMFVLTVVGLLAVLFTATSTRNAWYEQQEWVMSQAMMLNGIIFLIGVIFQYKGMSLFLRYMYDYRRALKAPLEQ